MTKSITGSFKLLEQALDTTLKHSRIATLIMSGPFVLWLIASGLAEIGHRGYNPLILALPIFSIAIVAVIFNIMSMIALTSLFGSDKRSLHGYLSDSFRILKSYIWIALLNGLIVGGSTAFFILPGIVFGILFSFASQSLILEGHKGMSALLRSKQLVRPYFWAVFGRILFFGLSSVLVSFVLRTLVSLTNSGIASALVQLFFYFFWIPLSIAYFVLLFKDLKQVSDEPFEYKKTEAKKYLLIGFGGIAFAIIVITILSFYDIKLIT